MKETFALATDDEWKIAGDAAQAVIKATEGRRFVVLAELLALTFAYYAAQIAEKGQIDPNEAMSDLAEAVVQRAKVYHDRGVIGKAH